MQRRWHGAWPTMCRSHYGISTTVEASKHGICSIGITARDHGGGSMGRTAQDTLLQLMEPMEPRTPCCSSLLLLGNRSSSRVLLGEVSMGLMACLQGAMRWLVRVGSWGLCAPPNLLLPTCLSRRTDAAYCQALISSPSIFQLIPANAPCEAPHAGRIGTCEAQGRVRHRNV